VQKKDIQNLNSKGKNIICFGDSLTFGYGAASGADYPSALAKMVDRPVINAGVDADTTAEALKRLESDVLSRDPFLVIVEFGGNDFLRQVPQETTIKNIKEIVEKIQAKGAMVAIVDISAGFFMRDYRLAFYNLSREIGAIFIPSILNNIITNPSMKSDFLHPNNNGYRIIADTVYRAIKPYLKAA
jgi:lysophospholipase L1-like esterase